MKRKLWRRFALSPAIIGVLWFLTSLVFRLLVTIGIDPAATSGLLEVVKTFINRILWLLGLASIVLCIIGIVFLSTSKKNATKLFTTKEIIQFSRTAAKKNMSKFLLWFAIYMVLQIISSSLGYGEESGNTQIWNAAITLFVSLLALWLWLWFKKLSLNIVHQVKAKFSDVFIGIHAALKYLRAYILTTIIVILWILLFIVPWIIFALRLSMVPYLIIDKNMWPIQAIKTSRKITKWFVGDIFILGLLCWLINILWFLVILVWLLWTVPLFMIANAYLYKKIIESQKLKAKN